MPSNLRRWNEPGHIHFLTISCFQRLPFFGRPEIRDIVVECMADARDRLSIRWIGYVVMPEHVHWLIYPQKTGSSPPVPISTVLESLKTSVGRRVKQAWREIWRAQRTFEHDELDRWALGSSSPKPIWMPRGVDFNVYDYPRLRQKLDYCHNNPVKRELVQQPQDWPWSSFTHYFGLGDVSLRMDWDGQSLLD